MDASLDSMFEDLETLLTKEFPHYLVKVSQVKKYFYVLIRKCRVKILNEKIKQLFDIVENVCKSIYCNHCRNCKDLTFFFFFFILNFSETMVIITSIF